MDADLRIRCNVIKTKLDNERSLLSQLENSMETSNELTTQMSDILQSFSERLDRTEAAIIPIHQQSTGLQQIQNNISKTIGAFDNIIGYHHVTKEVEPTINQGPSGQLDKYIQYLARTDKAIDFFNRTNPNSNELVRAKELIEVGVQNMEHHLINLLKRHSKPLNCDNLHDLISLKQMISPTLKHFDKSTSNSMDLPEDATVEDLQEILEERTTEVLKDLLPEVTVNEVNRVAEWLTTHARNQEYSSKYAKLRYEVCDKTVTLYKSYVKQNQILVKTRSQTGTAGLGTPKGDRKTKSSISTTSFISGGSSTDSPMMSGNRGDRVAHGTAVNRRPSAAAATSQDYAQKRQTLRRQVQAQIGKRNSHAVFLDSGISSLSSPVIENITSTDVNDEAVDFLKLEYTVTLELLRLEKLLIEKLIPSKNNVLIRSVFSQITGPLFKDLKQDVEVLVKHCTEKVNKREYKESLMHLPFTDHVRKHSITLSKMLVDCTKEVQESASNFTIDLHRIGGRMIEEFVMTVKNDPDKESNMPPDGTVHELTSKTLLMVSHLDSYHEATTIMASSMNKGSTFQNILSEIMEALNTNLTRKARYYNKSSLQRLFLLNNFNYIVKGLSKGNLPKVYREGINSMKERSSKYRQEFTNSWSKLKILFTTRLKTGDDVSEVGQLTDKHKQLLKEKFKSINSLTDELCKEHNNYTVPDTDMRTAIKIDLCNMLLPVYSEFYKKIKMVNFSSHQGKYMKIDPDTLAVKIDALFQR